MYRGGIERRRRYESPYVSREWPNAMYPSGGAGTTVDHAKPSRLAGNATARPASGPAAAMSNSAFRLRAGERIRMIAPSVPKRKGGGTKTGRLTAAREGRARRGGAR